LDWVLQVQTVADILQGQERWRDRVGAVLAKHFWIEDKLNYKRVFRNLNVRIM
jgi:hypothetical protein